MIHVITNKIGSRFFIANSETKEGTSSWARSMDDALFEYNQRKVAHNHSYWRDDKSNSYFCIGVFKTIDDIPDCYDCEAAAKLFPELFI